MFRQSHLIAYICYLVASHLNWPRYSWSLWRCFGFLFNEIQFLCQIFPFFFFVAMSKYNSYYYFTPLRVFETCSSWSSKSPQVSETLLSILAGLKSVVASIVSTLDLIFNSSSLFTNSLVTVGIIICMTVTFMFQGYFDFSSKVHVLISLFDFCHFFLWSAQMAKFTIRQFLYFLLTISYYYYYWLLIFFHKR